MFRRIMTLLIALGLILVGVSPVFAEADDQGQNAVYVMSNASSGNQVLVYHRASDGSLAYQGTFATGGLGSGIGLTVPPDPLGSQDSLLVSPDGRWLFAVNAGSNEVSLFKVQSNGLRLTAKASSGGIYPVSLTLNQDLLYVLNAAGDGSITGFKVDDGHLMPLAGSTRSLNAATPAVGAQPHILESPAQVGFTPDGTHLVITDKGGVSGVGRILVFQVGPNGLPGAAPVVFNTQSPVPFAFTFDRYGHLVVVDAAAGSITSYAVQGNGSLSELSSVTNGQAAVCWVDGNSQYIFTDNTGSGTVSAIKPAPSGGLKLLNATAGNYGPGTLPLDMGISKNGKYLYSLNVGAGTIGAYRINRDGSLTALDATGGLPQVGGFQGIAVY